MNIITKNHIIEFAALTVSITLFNSIKKGKLKSLPFFLLFILFVELFGSYLYRVQKVNNNWLYNLSIPIEYSYYCYLFWLHAENMLKRLLKVLYVFFLLIVFYHFVAIPLKIFYTNMLIAGQVLVIVSCCIYIYELFRKDAEEPLVKQYFFWIITGLLLFNLGDFVYFLFLPVIHSSGWDRFDFIFRMVNNSLLYILYLSYIMAMIVYYRSQRRILHAA